MDSAIGDRRADPTDRGDGGMIATVSRPGLSPWRMVIGIGLVSLTVDMVADGAHSVSGPLLAQLAASALVVGVVTGAADAAGLTLRLVTGPWADRTRRYWAFTIAGYALTAVSVPLLAATPFLGVAGLVVAGTLLVVERMGKAVRAPAKTVLLADAAGAVGRGRGFGVHKTLDQVGAFLGPLVAAGVIAATGAMWPAFLVLVVPAVVAMVLLVGLRRRVPDPSLYRPATPAAAEATAVDRTPAPHRGIPVRFWLFAVSCALTTFGLVGFGVISYHLEVAGLVPLAAVPLVYAIGMLAGGVAALASGWAYDRAGAGTLLAVPVLVAAIPSLALADALPALLVGVVAWGAAVGIQDSTVKALVADLVPTERRGTAFGMFAVLQGATTFAGAALAGALYPDHGRLALVVGVAQLLALVLLIVVLRRQRGGRGTGVIAAHGGAGIRC